MRKTLKFGGFGKSYCCCIICIVLKVPRIDTWYGIFKTYDIGLIEGEHLLQVQSHGNIFDYVHYRDHQFIPKLRTVLSDCFGSPQMTNTKKFHSKLRYNPSRGEFAGYYDIFYKNLTLCRQSADSVVQLSEQSVFHLRVIDFGNLV